MIQMLDKNGHSHNVASCPCWKCNVFRLVGLASGGRLAEGESKVMRVQSQQQQQTQAAENSWIDFGRTM